jgi:phage anti-repressor protein
MNAAKEKAPTRQRQGFGVNHYEAIHMANTTAVQGGAQQLVRVFDGVIGGMPSQVCDGRELHSYLKNGKQFSDWIKHRIEQYGFEENQDFMSFSPKSEKPQGGVIASPKSEAKRGGHNRTDYHLTLDMAKELSMVENNEQGRAARRYFIAMERQALAAPQTGVTVPAQLDRLDHSFQGRRIEFLVGGGQVWCKASTICTALGLGSSDRITRGLPDGNKLARLRGRQRHIYIDAAAAQRAGDYVRDASKAKAWTDWITRVLSDMSRAPLDAGAACLDEQTQACLYALCEAGDRLVRAHHELAPVHQAMRSNALIGVGAALETLVVAGRHLRAQFGDGMLEAAQRSGLADVASPNLLGVQLSAALGQPPLAGELHPQTVAPPLQGELIADEELTPVQRFGLTALLDTRLILAFDHVGQLQVRPVTPDAVVVPLNKLPAIVADPFALPAAQLPGLLEAVTARMKTLVSAA